MEKITMFNGKIHYTWPFSIAIFVYQRVLDFHKVLVFVNGLDPTITG
jgi:hypothetical protein